MRSEQVEAVWLTEDARFSLEELAEVAGIPEDEVRELIDYGAVMPIDPDAPTLIFDGRCLLSIRTAARLRVGFDLEPHGVALIVSLLDRIHALESQLGSLRAQMPQRR
jgi:chaperone modulatory protein CbpM